MEFHSLLTHEPTEIVLTSQLHELTASTDAVKVNVKITRDPDGDADVIYDNDVYAYGGMVRVYDVSTLIETNFALHSHVFDMVSIRIGDETARFTAVYGKTEVLRVEPIISGFLTETKNSFVHHDTPILLSHIPDGHCEYAVKVVGKNADDRLVVAEYSVEHDDGHGLLDTTFDELIAADNAREIVEPCYLTISYRSAQKTYYLTPGTEYIRFAYRNCYNAPECIDVSGLITLSVKADRDTAVCSGLFTQYNKTVETTYELQTGALTTNQLLEVISLITSDTVTMTTSVGICPVIITEHTVEPNNDNDTLHTVKLKFRFANTRLQLSLNELTPRTNSSGRIFSGEYTPEFS